jgi:hypothetical protein
MWRVLAKVRLGYKNRAQVLSHDSMSKERQGSGYEYDLK